MEGTVKFFNTEKGFGFIAGEDGKEYFVHTSAVAEGITLNENDAVTFDVVAGDRGPKADNVAMNDGSAPAAEEPAEEEAEEPADDAADDDDAGDDSDDEEPADDDSDDGDDEEEEVVAPAA